jgi:amino acid adenylation domain-containing protein
MEITEATPGSATVAPAGSSARPSPGGERSRLLALDGRARAASVEELLREQIVGLLGAGAGAGGELGPDASLERLGIDSRDALTLLEAVEDRLGVELPLHLVLAAASLGEAAEAIASLFDGADAFVRPVVDDAPAESDELFPLSAIQRAYWLGRNRAFGLGGVAAHLYVEFEPEALDVDRLRTALDALVRRHGMLRAVVHDDGTQQILADPGATPFRVVDLRDAAAHERDSQLERHRLGVSHEVRPLGAWPMFDVTAFLRAEGSVRVACSVDLLLVDAGSAVIVLQDLADLYLDPGRRERPLGLSFRDYVLATGTGDREPEAGHRAGPWRDYLRALPPAPKLPLAAPLASVSEPRFDRLELTIGPEEWTRLRTRATAENVTPTVLIATAFSEVLAAWCEQRAFTLNVTLFNREPVHPDVEALVGEFTSLVLVGADLRQGEPFTRRLRAMQTSFWEALSHRRQSSLDLLREVSLAQGVAATQPAMPVVLTSLIGQDVDFGPLGRPTYAISQTPQVVLDHQLYETDGGLVVSWDYVTAALAPGIAAQMFDAYAQLLARLAGPTSDWSEPVPVLVPPAHRDVVDATNATTGPVPDGGLHDRFFAGALRHPDRPAVVNGSTTLTYGQLARHASTLARRLREGGAGRDRLVAVVMDRGWEQVVAVLGVLAAGAAYLPIAADLPQERIELLIERGECRLIVTQPGTRHASWAGDRTVLVVDSSDALDEEIAFEPGDPTALAYVIFTSGSTGVPKGVMVEHRSALNTVVDIADRYGISSTDTVLSLSSLGFDLSVFDLFGLLGAGGRVVIPRPEEARDPSRWADLVRVGAVTVWNSVPALAEGLADYLQKQPSAAVDPLRVCLLSGDWVPVGLPDRLRSRVPGLRVVALGGATEGSIWSIAHDLDVVDPCWDSIPYGRPLRNQRIFVVDDGLHEQPIGVAGEILIGGVGVARGYWRDAERTAESFVPHPGTGEVVYRTGDRGRRMPDGTVVFLGRSDTQVKLRGHRVELGEIEAVLGARAGVRDAVAVVQRGPGGGQHLAAFAVPDGTAAIDAGDLRAFLRDRLPSYMVPSAVTVLGSFPLTANGKVDRRALAAPAPEEPSEATGVDERVGRLSRLLHDVAGIAGVGPDDDLFELGLDSLDAIRLVNSAEVELGARPDLEILFANPTLRSLAAFYDDVASEPGEVVPPAAPDRRPFPTLVTHADRESHKQRRDVLPSFEGLSGVSLLVSDQSGEAVHRRSEQTFSSSTVSFGSLSQLLNCVRAGRGSRAGRRLYPSAGGTYAVQLYLDIKPDRIERIDGGLYAFDPERHRLVLMDSSCRVSARDHFPFNREASEACALTVMLVAAMDVLDPLYGALARDFALVEAGALLQLLMVSSPPAGLAMCPIGALTRDPLDGIVGERRLIVHSALVGGRHAPEAPETMQVEVTI